MSSIDPCLKMRKSEKDVVYIALYVDAKLMVWNLEVINDAIETL